MELLDRTERRIVGVLIEKQLSVPDSYPLTENALLAGCNQSSNRDPVMELESFQLRGALMALHEKEWVARVEGGGRVPRYRHRLEERLGLEGAALPLLAELLLRGPQAPGALKPRVARMAWTATPGEIEDLLHQLAQRSPALVEQLPLRPRERGQRWRHLLGGDDQSEVGGSRDAVAMEPAAAKLASPAPAPTPVPMPLPRAPQLADRVAALEQQVAELQRLVADLRGSTD